MVMQLRSYAARGVAMLTLGECLRDAICETFAQAADRELVDRLIGETGWKILHGEVEWVDVIALRDRCADVARSVPPARRWIDSEDERRQTAAQRASAHIAVGISGYLATASTYVVATAFQQADVIGHSDWPADWWRRVMARLPICGASSVQIGNLTPTLVRGLTHDSVEVAQAAASVLQFAPDPAAGGALLAATSRYVGIAEAALEALSAAGPTALRDWQPVVDLAVLPAIADRFRIAAARTLATIRHEPAVPALAAVALNVAEPSLLRREALAVLTAIDSPESRKALHQLAHDPVSNLAVPSRVALARRHEIDGVELIDQLLDGRSRPSHPDLLRALPDCVNATHVVRLLDLLDLHGRAVHDALRSIPRVHLIAASLDRVLKNGPTPAPALVKMLTATDLLRDVRQRLGRILLDDGGDTARRVAAAWALGHIGTPAALHDLDAAAAAPDRAMRKAVGQIRRRLGLSAPRHRNRRRSDPRHRPAGRCHRPSRHSGPRLPGC